MVVLNNILDQMIKLKDHLSKAGENPPDIELRLKAKLHLGLSTPSKSFKIGGQDALKFMNDIEQFKQSGVVGQVLAVIVNNLYKVNSFFPANANAVWSGITLTVLIEDTRPKKFKAFRDGKVQIGKPIEIGIHEFKILMDELKILKQQTGV